MPPSMIVPLPAAKGVLPPSGQVKFSVPLSVVNTTIVLSSRPSAFNLSIRPLRRHRSELLHHAFFQVPLVFRRQLRLILRRQMRDDVSAGRVEPDEERLAVLLGLVDELDRVIEDVLVDRLHIVFDARHWMRRQRPLIGDRLLADLAPTRLLCRIVDVGRGAVNEIARPNRVHQGLRIGMPERVLHRVEVIEVAEEFVEAVHGRQITVLKFAKIAFLPNCPVSYPQ